jgi:hypothetical protein
MATNKKKKRIDIRIVIACIGLIIVLIILLTLVNKLINSSSTDSVEQVKAQFTTAKEEKAKADLSGMTEQERMTYYTSEFFKLVDSGRYEDAYALLYDDYKENFFPTEANFEKYFKEYFPDDFSLSYTNMERLGSIYVLWVSVKDTVNGSKYGHNFSMNVVIQENALNDYVISFSRDSAVNSTKEEE